MKTAALTVLVALWVASLACVSALSNLAPRHAVRNFAPVPSVGLRGGAPKLTDEQVPLESDSRLPLHNITGICSRAGKDVWAGQALERG